MMDVRLKNSNKIYLIKAGEFYKIGCSKAPSYRLRAIQTSCPRKPELIFSRTVGRAFELEAALHEVYAKTNTYGEWFTDIDYHEFVRIIDYYELKIMWKTQPDNFAEWITAYRSVSA